MAVSSPDQTDVSALNFAQEVRDGRFSFRQGLAILLLGLLVLFDGMDTQILGVVAHDIMAELGLPIADFGLVFSAGLLGGIVGALLISPLADKQLGRKTVVIGAMTVASLATIATPLAFDMVSLLAIRFIAGVGLGAALPSIFTLVAEFCPARHSRRLTSSLIAFMPLGSLIGGVIGRVVVPDHGWEMLLYLGGGLTLVLTLLAAIGVPESVYFLLHVKKAPDRALRAARTLLAPRTISALAREEVAVNVEQKQPVAMLFTNGFWKLTGLLWLSYIMNQGILYFVLSWTPALLQKSGLAATAGMDAASTFGIGGALGTAIQGWLATKFNLYKIMFVEMAIFLVGILTLPLMLTDPVLAPVTIFFVAAGICAYHAGFILLVIESYPVAIRTTAFGWALGVGRIGATTAPVLAGALVALGWSPGQIFAAAAVPGAISFSALMGIILVLERRKQAAPELHPRGA